MVTMKPGLDFADTLQVHDGGAMDAHEFLWIEFCFHVIHVAAHQMRCCTAMEPKIVAFRFDPVEIAHVEEQKTTFDGDGDSFQIVPLLGHLFQQTRELMIWRLLLSKV